MMSLIFLIVHLASANPQALLHDHPLIIELINSRAGAVEPSHQMPRLRQLMDAETRSPAWADDTENTLRQQVIATLPDPESQQADGRCSSTMCEVVVLAVVTPTSKQSRVTAFRQTAARVAYKLGVDVRTTAYATDEANGQQVIVSYLVQIPERR